MPFVGGLPPGPNAGDISPLTQALRPPVRLPPAQCSRARRLRRRGWEVEDIADRLGTTAEKVEEALATMRTPKPDATRANLNVTTAAREFVAREAEDDEAIWAVVDRLFVELMYRRAQARVPLVRGEPPPGN